jgi:hypothetical protein
MKMKVNKDYMLRTRLSPLEKARLELLVAYYKEELGKKVSKATIFGHLVSKEFDKMQFKIVELVDKGV